MLDRTTREPVVDFALNLPILNLEDDSVVVSLPTIGADKHYIVLVEQEEGLDLRATREGRRLLYVN